MTTYIVARTANSRPSLQHALSDDGVTTECGLDSSGWSRAYMATMIPQIVCKKCAPKVGRY